MYIAWKFGYCLKGKYLFEGVMSKIETGSNVFVSYVVFCWSYSSNNDNTAMNYIIEFKKVYSHKALQIYWHENTF